MFDVRKVFDGRKLHLAIAMGAALASGWSSIALAKDESTPDWPCVWRKVIEIDAAAIWDGPSLDGAKDWMKDDAVRKLSAYLISRRLKPEEVEAAIAKFAEGVPEATRDAKLTELFTASLSRTNDERKIVMSGIERFHKRQLARAKEIEAAGIDLKDADAIQPAPEGQGTTGPAGKIEDVQAAAAAAAKDDPEEKMKWEVRVFQERQQNIPIACEIPQLMDERAGVIARAIRALMKS
ncbi:MAG: hypothetical protein HOP09_10545 [Hyphomicrobium sp.]|nr:hypothetical protein [Hyphomicrobium sp.]